MESLGSIIAEHILPFLYETCIHIRFSIQDIRLKRKRFNQRRDIFVSKEKIPMLIEWLETNQKNNRQNFLNVDKLSKYLLLGGSGKDQLLEKELSQFLHYPFENQFFVKDDYKISVNKSCEKFYDIYIMFI